MATRQARATTGWHIELFDTLGFHLYYKLLLAGRKTLLKPRVFSIPTRRTFVLHPGICPEYRNAHGCFWALVNDDLEKEGMTLLRIDEGIDTGPV